MDPTGVVTGWFPPRLAEAIRTDGHLVVTRSRLTHTAQIPGCLLLRTADRRVYILENGFAFLLSREELERLYDDRVVA